MAEEEPKPVNSPEPAAPSELAAVVKKRGWLRGNSGWVRPTHDELRAYYGTRKE